MKRLLVFEGGAGIVDDKSMNKFDINGKPPVDSVSPTKANIKKYMKEHKYPPLKKER